MNGLNEIEKMLLIASHDAKKCGKQKELCEKPLADLNKLKSLLAKLMRATFNGDINPEFRIGPGMQAEITAVAKEINTFLNK